MCKKKCGPCKRCKKGKCKPKPAGTACAGGTCQGGSCVTAAANVPPSPPLACGSGGPCRVFLSSTTHGGNLKGRSVSGLAGADAICQRLASDANLPGIYKAWLSDSFNSPTSRFVPSSGPYQLVNGATIAANFTESFGRWSDWMAAARLLSSGSLPWRSSPQPVLSRDPPALLHPNVRRAAQDHGRVGGTSTC